MVIPSWNTSLWDDEDRDAIANGTFDSDTVQTQYSAFKSKNLPKSEKRADITENVMDIDNIDW